MQFYAILATLVAAVSVSASLAPAVRAAAEPQGADLQSREPKACSGNPGCDCLVLPWATAPRIAAKRQRDILK